MKELTYHTYNPSTDTLEVGTKIRLAGREGEITLYCEDSWFVGIRWSNGDAVEFAGLKDFPLLEIADKPVNPLTIDKRVKGEELMKILANTGIVSKEVADYKDHEKMDSDTAWTFGQLNMLVRVTKAVETYLDSLEET